MRIAKGMTFRTPSGQTTIQIVEKTKTNGDDIDSCWGFYPDHDDDPKKDWANRHKYMIGEAESSIDNWREERLKQLRQERRGRQLALSGSAGAA